MSGEGTVETLVREAFSAARQGAVLVVEGKDYHPTRVRWLGHQLARDIAGAEVHRAGESLFLVLIPHAGPAEAWLVVDRLKRSLARTGWERAVVASATWPVQGSSPTDVVAAALAALFDARARLERETPGWTWAFDVDGQGLSFHAEAELLTG